MFISVESETKTCESYGFVRRILFIFYKRVNPTDLLDLKRCIDTVVLKKLSNLQATVLQIF